MHALCLLSLALVAPLQRVVAQGEVHVDDRLPPASIELKTGQPPTTSRADFAADQYPDRPDILARIVSAAHTYGDPLTSSSDNSISYYLRRVDYVGRCDAPFGPVHVARLSYTRSAPHGGHQPARGHTFVVFLDPRFHIRGIWRVDAPLDQLSVAGSRLLLADSTLVDFSHIPSSRTVVVDGAPQKVPLWK